LGFEIRGNIADLQRHGIPPSPLRHSTYCAVYTGALRSRNSDRNESAIASVALGGKRIQRCQIVP
jgi:hypothetical protein